MCSPEKDSGDGVENMCREFHDFSHEFSPNMMKIDRDHPPEPPHVENLPRAMGELVQLSARSYDSSSPPQPAEKTHDWNVKWGGEGYLRSVRERRRFAPTLLDRSNDLAALVPTVQESWSESSDHPFVPLADRSE